MLTHVSATGCLLVLKDHSLQPSAIGRQPDQRGAEAEGAEQAHWAGRPGAKTRKKTEDPGLLVFSSWLLVIQHRAARSAARMPRAFALVAGAIRCNPLQTFQLSAFSHQLSAVQSPDAFSCAHFARGRAGSAVGAIVGATLSNPGFNLSSPKLKLLETA
jgi:hypothetical protein